jgi:hypothetical protein
MIIRIFLALATMLGATVALTLSAWAGAVIAASAAACLAFLHFYSTVGLVKTKDAEIRRLKRGLKEAKSNERDDGLNEEASYSF